MENVRCWILGIDFRKNEGSFILKTVHQTLRFTFQSLESVIFLNKTLYYEHEQTTYTKSWNYCEPRTA